MVKRWRTSPLALRLMGWLVVLTTFPMLGTVFLSGTALETALGRAATGPRSEVARLLAQDLSQQPPSQWHLVTSQGLRELEVFVVDRSGSYLVRRAMASGSMSSGLAADFPPVVVASVLSGTEGTFLDPAWRSIQLSYCPIPGHQASVVVRSQASDVSAFASDFQNRLYTQIGLLALLISLAGGAVLWITVGNPVVALSQAAERMGQGDFSTRVNAEAMIDDLKNLAVTFNAMSDQIRTLVSNQRDLNVNLEVKVEQRTSELRKANEDLEAVLGHLRSTQDQLMRNERFTALGQLSANLLHELNSPLGAIDSAVRSQQHILERDLHPALSRLQSLPPELRDDLLACAVAEDPHGSRVGREHRERREELLQFAHEQGVQDNLGFADAAASLGFTAGHHLLPVLAARPDGVAALRAAETIASLGALARVIGLAEEKAAVVVARLRGYLIHGGVEDRHELDIEAELDSVLQALNPPSSQVVVVRHYSGVRVWGSALGLKEVWGHLVKNALQALDGAGRLEIVTSVQGPWIIVRITDSGPGIAAEHQPHIFEPFFTTKASGTALGLGLDIARSQVERHGGHLTFTSKPGETAFTVALPA